MNPKIDISPLVYPRTTPFITPGVIPTPFVANGVLVVGVAMNPAEGFTPPMVETKQFDSPYTIGASGLGYFLDLFFPGFATSIRSLSSELKSLVARGVITTAPVTDRAKRVFWARTTNPLELFSPITTWALQQPSDVERRAALAVIRGGGVNLRQVRIKQDGSLHEFRRSPVFAPLPPELAHESIFVSGGDVPEFESRLDPRPVLWFTEDSQAIPRAFEKIFHGLPLTADAISFALRYFGFYPDGDYRLARGTKDFVWNSFYRYTTLSRITRSGEWRTIKRGAGVRLTHLEGRKPFPKRPDHTDESFIL